MRFMRELFPIPLSPATMTFIEIGMLVHKPVSPSADITPNSLPIERPCFFGSVEGLRNDWRTQGAGEAL